MLLLSGHDTALSEPAEGNLCGMNAKELSDTCMHLISTQIAELMDFSSLSHFSRYCSKHLGQSPNDYRQNLQPKRK